MFDPKPDPRASAFERPSTMRTPLTSSFDVGKNTWSHDRSIWNSSNTSTIRTNEGDRSRPRVFRQDSTTSLKFGGLPNNVPLSPLENPRTSNPSSGMGWATAAARQSESQQRPQLTSPTKQTQSSWLYNNRSEVDVENSSLLAGSAPESEYFAVPSIRDHVTARNIYRHIEKDHSSATRFDDNNRSSTATFRPYHETRAPVSIGNTKSGKNSGIGPFTGHSTKPQELINSVSETASPTTRGFGRGSALRNGTVTISPTQSRFSRQAAFDAYVNGGGAGPKTPTEELDHAFSGLSIDQKGGAPASNQGEGYAYEFSHAVNGSFSAQQNQHNQHHLRFPTDCGSNGAATLFEPNHTHTPFHYQSIWNYGDQETLSPSVSDNKYHLSSPYYSATGTPPTGPESVRSAGGSGISSRTSHHEFALVDRKLRNLQLYQPYQHTQSNGFLPVPGPGYDLSIHHSTMRMNPLAAPYHVAGNDGFHGRFGSNPPMPPYEPDQIQIIRSPLLEEFRLSSKTNKRYELRDIFNYVVEFSGDQHGSRFIQQKLETANSDEKDQIFKEISPNSLQLMTDVFGNYVIQKLFEHGNQSQKKVLANHMKGHVLTLSTQMYGCRVVQKALEHVLTNQQASMVKELEGPNKQILKVIRDQNGNHVIQKAIERVPAEHIQFIIDAHRGEVVKLATHTYGCRVIQRILEHCAPVAKRVILDELHGCVGPLITDSFGNYVVQHVIQNGEPDDRRRVVSIVQQQLLVFSKHKFASNVVEKCIEYADDDQRGDIVAKLIGHNEQGQTPVLGLLRDQYGNYVIQRIHSVLKGAEFEALTNEMKLCFPQLKRTSYGKQVMAIEKLLYGINGSQSAISTSSHSSTMDVSHASHGSEEHPHGVPSMQQGQMQVILPVGI